jgi:hypothetical protein
VIIETPGLDFDDARIVAVEHRNFKALRYADGFNIP